MDTLTQTLDQFSSQVNADSEQEFNSSMQTRSILFIVGIIIVIIALVLTFIMAVILIRAVVEPVKQLQEAMDSMKHG